MWRVHSRESGEASARLSRQISGDDLDKAFLYRKMIDQQTYDRQRDLTRERIAMAEVELAEATADELGVEGVPAFAQRVLGDAARLGGRRTPSRSCNCSSLYFSKDSDTRLQGLGPP